jgi:uncharacterized protein YsxB (DUF464 family)
MKQMKQKNPNKSHDFFCEKCNYITNNKKDFNKHLLTSKHQNETNETVFETKKPKKSQQHRCEKCFEKFNSRSTLWRHKQKCTGEKFENLQQKDLDKEKDLISFIIQQFVQLQKQAPDNVVVNTIGNTNTNNSYNNNKTFNLQLFLNETCKDAMNIKEFADSVQLELSDLENVGKSGYIEGISNIIIKNLNALEMEKRPIHCTDNKREVIYIKDEDKWEKEEDNKPKLRKLIKEIAHKNICMFKKFREKYPDCDNSDSRKSDLFNKIVYESMGGKGDDEGFKENKIMHKISKQVGIDKVHLIHL